MSSRRLLVTLVAVLAVLLSGCGGGGDAVSLPEFKQSIVTTRDRVDFSLERITNATSKDQFLNRMDEAADTIDDAADDLAGVEAPEDYAPETTQLVDSLRQLAVDLEAVAHDARQPGGEGLLTSAAGLNFDSWDKANLALAGLAGKGIEVRLIQRH